MPFKHTISDDMTGGTQQKQVSIRAIAMVTIYMVHFQNARICIESAIHAFVGSLSEQAITQPCHANRSLLLSLYPRVFSGTCFGSATSTAKLSAFANELEWRAADATVSDVRRSPISLLCTPTRTKKIKLVRWLKRCRAPRTRSILYHTLSPDTQSFGGSSPMSMFESCLSASSTTSRRNHFKTTATCTEHVCILSER